MPITKSAKKALRQSFRKREKNLKKKRQVKSLLKQEKRLAQQQQTGEAGKLLPQIYKALDKAAKTGVLKANAAARKKSRAARLLVDKTSSKETPQ